MMRLLRNLEKKVVGKDAQKGMSLLEAVVAVGILGGVIITMVFAMSGGALTVRENSQETTVQNLARNQMEYIKNYPYNPSASTYPTISTPPGYSIVVSVTSVPDTSSSIQKVTANISRDSVLLMSVSDYKGDR